ncbi:hypothetical protein Y1Q_0000653 [Alligator mississippiensis]|uniref:Uncharacterized protein n=1 Tax=Alligator mississippiensis TaxID=8496 RepID=A0A151MBY6_ALLMI|nr:hypothetical protein Y1Q_0000653 [Alligator mississippiensis]
MEAALATQCLAPGHACRKSMQDSSKTPYSRHPYWAPAQEEKAPSLHLSVTQADRKHPSGKGWHVGEEKPHRRHANKVALGHTGTTDHHLLRYLMLRPVQPLAPITSHLLCSVFNLNHSPEASAWHETKKICYQTEEEQKDMERKKGNWR